MSIPITKATISGSELPTGDLVSIFRYPDDATGVWYVTKPVGSVAGPNPTFCVKAFYAMPPTENDGVFTDGAPNSSPVYSTSNTVGGQVTNLVANGTDGYSWYTVCDRARVTAGSTSIHPDVTSWGVGSIGGFMYEIIGKVYLLRGTTYHQNAAGWSNSFGVLAGGITTADFGAGFGVASNVVYIMSTGSTPKVPTYYNISRSARLELSRCVIVDDSAVTYGAAFLNGAAGAEGEVIVLLNPNGLCARIPLQTFYQTYTGAIPDLPVTYFSLVVPAGGEVKHLASSGYYLATDGSSNLYIYSVTDGGTPVAQLDPGVYDVAESLELFKFV